MSRPHNLSTERAAELTDWIASMPIARTLGAKCVATAPGTAELRMGFAPAISYGAGPGFPASAVGALVDFCGGVAVGTLLPVGTPAATVDYSVRMLAPAQGDELVARGRVARDEGSVMVSTVEVFDGPDAASPVAIGTVAMKPLRGT